MKTMLFVVVQNMSLIGYSAFTNTLVQYRKCVALRESHKIRSVRQGLAAIWKHFIIQHHVETVAMMATGIAKGFEHGLSSSRTSYGVDTGKTAGNASIGYYMAKKLCAIFQQKTNPIFRETDPRYFVRGTRESDSTKAKSEADSVGDTWDLVEAGSVLMSELASRTAQSQDFKFKSTNQLIFTSSVLQSDRLILALQAPTAFGKTLTYVLPMLVLKKTRPGRYIHFVAVPYVSLKVATIKRLRSYGLDAIDSRLVHNAELKDDTTFSSVDVIVGTFESLGAQWMYSLLNEWKCEFRELPTKEKGYFVVDEAHVLWLERKFRPQLNKIVSLKWTGFLRIVMLSATLSRWLFEKVCEQMNFSSHALRNARWANAVEEVPNAAVLKDITRTDARTAKNIICDRINSYLHNTVEGKAVFFFQSKRLLREYYEIWKNNEAVAAVDADMTESRKLEIFREFESSKSKTRVVMDTKLVSNGLDCPSVNYVCLVRCDVNVIDFLQMVGRIRTKGYLEVVDEERNAAAASNWEVVEHPDLLSMRWSIPVDETVAKFYGLENRARTEAVAGDGYYQNTYEAVIQLRQQVQQRVPIRETAHVIESTCDEDSVSGMLKLAMRSLQDKSGIYKSELRDILKKESKIYLPRFRDLLNGVAPNAVLDLESDTFPGVCSDCYMRNGLCQCHSFGKSMGKIINEVSVLCILRKKGLESLNEVFTRIKREGKGFMIIGFIVSNPKLWCEHYEWVANEVEAQRVEGIDCSKEEADKAISLYENFWFFLLDQRIDVLKLVFDNQRIKTSAHGNGGWSQTLFYNAEQDPSISTLQRVMFSQKNRSMIELLSQKYWDDTLMEFGCYNRDQFEMLLALLFCIFSKGDASDIIGKHVVGFCSFSVYPLWIGSMVCRKWCGNKPHVPVFVFVVGMYILKRGWKGLLIGQ